MQTIVKSFLGLLVIVAVLLAVTKYSGLVQEKAKGVLGVHIGGEKKDPLPENIQKDVVSSLEDVKKKGMETNVQDIMGYVKRTQKVIDDYRSVQKEIQKVADDFFKQHVKASGSASDKK